MKTKCAECKQDCETELDPNWLIKGERYEARTRVLAGNKWAKSQWSEWSPTTSWVSLEGKTKPSGKIVEYVYQDTTVNHDVSL